MKPERAIARDLHEAEGRVGTALPHHSARRLKRRAQSERPKRGPKARAGSSHEPALCAGEPGTQPRNGNQRRAP